MVDGDGVLDGVIAEIVGGAIDGAPLHPPAGDPDAEPERIVIAAVRPLRERRPAELPRPDDERLLEEPTTFQVVDQPGNRLVDLSGHLAMAGFQATVLVPRIADLPEFGGTRQAGELDEAHAAFHEAPGEEALPAVLDRFPHR